MKKLDRNVLIELGFVKNYVSQEESGDKAYVYYTKDLNEHETLISTAADYPIKGDELFTVELFNTELGFCETDEEVKILYKALTKKEL